MSQKKTFKEMTDEELNQFRNQSISNNRKFDCERLKRYLKRSGRWLPYNSDFELLVQLAEESF